MCQVVTEPAIDKLASGEKFGIKFVVTPQAHIPHRISAMHQVSTELTVEDIHHGYGN